jgi:hypothetical protein
MPKRDNKRTEPYKVPKTVYLLRDTVRRLEKAAKDEGVSYSVYIERALKERLKKEGIE